MFFSQVEPCKNGNNNNNMYVPLQLLYEQFGKSARYEHTTIAHNPQVCNGDMIHETTKMVNKRTNNKFKKFYIVSG